MAKIYCAGPLFNGPEQGEMLEIASRLERAGHQTFLPQRDGLELAQLEPVVAQLADTRIATDVLHRAIFSFDVFKLISWSDGVVANFNGRVPDEGTVVESALAWHSGKALVIYKNDSRSAFDGRDNPMLTGLADGRFASDLDQMLHALELQFAEAPTGRLRRMLRIGSYIDIARAESDDPTRIATALLQIAAERGP